LPFKTFSLFIAYFKRVRKNKITSKGGGNIYGVIGKRKYNVSIRIKIVFCNIITTMDKIYQKPKRQIVDVVV